MISLKLLENKNQWEKIIISRIIISFTRKKRGERQIDVQKLERQKKNRYRDEKIDIQINKKIERYIDRKINEERNEMKYCFDICLSFWQNDFLIT